PFEFDLEGLPFDCLEIWKGLIVEYNPIAIAWWQNMLVAGKKVPVCGGSDYHEDSLNRFPGGPTTCVYAMSNSPSDILSALKAGHAFITYAPYGPTLELSAGDAIMGDSVPYSRANRVEIIARGLSTGDVVQVVTAQGTTPLVKAATGGDFQGVYRVENPGFARIEILRSFLPSLPMLPALVSNPIYFDG
ncbi:MAG TPA: CehA/McbA family metallohydrolase, partial [Anaerolineales bacterium]